MSDFHPAPNLGNLDGARTFCGDLPGGGAGRSTRTRGNLDVFGPQIGPQLGAPFDRAPTGKLGDRMVPTPHVDVRLSMEEWRAFADRHVAADRADIVAPMALSDTFGAPLELEAKRDPSTSAFAA